MRTPAEWAFAGEPDLATIGKETLRISWKLFPTYTLNERFMQQLKATGVTQQTPLYFICRTGGRSLDAAIAATAEGFEHCYNITDGFDGSPNERRQRGQVKRMEGIRATLVAVVTESRRRHITRKKNKPDIGRNDS